MAAAPQPARERRTSGSRCPLWEALWEERESVLDRCFETAMLMAELAGKRSERFAQVAAEAARNHHDFEQLSKDLHRHRAAHGC